MKTNDTGTMPGAWRAAAAATLALSMLGTGLTASATPTTECTIDVNPVRSSTVDSTVKITGSTSGCESGKLVASAKSNGRWVTVGSTSVEGNGSFTVPLSGLSSPGTHDVHLTLGNTESRTIEVTRLHKPTISTADWSLIGATANAWGVIDGASSAEVWTEVRLKDGRWSRSQTRTTDARGNYVIPLTYGANTPGSYHYRVGARYADGTVIYTDATQVVRRAPKATAKTAGTAPVRTTANAWGTFSQGSHIQVWTEVRLPNGTWSRSQTRTTSSSGFYAIPLTYGANTPGTYQYRVAGRYPGGTVVRTHSVKLTRVAAPTIKTAGIAPVRKTANAWGTFSQGSRIQVWTEVRLPNGTWSRSQTRTTSSSGFYAIPLTYGANTPGTYQYRVAGRYPGGTVVRTKAVTFRRTNPAYNIDSRCYSGARVMCASKKDRKLYYVMNGKVVKVLDARFGARSHPTRNGVHYVYWKSRHHVSSIYGSAMPWAMFFDGGQAVHYSSNFARVGWNHPGSGGCINIRDAKTLDWIYKQIRNGDKVVVY